MKKKLLVSLIACIIILSLTGFSKQIYTNINVENNGKLSNIEVEEIGKDSLKKIGNGLWYDSITGIVYWWNGMLYEDAARSSRYDTTPSPYYAPNGLPYKYNPKTNTFEEID